MLQRLRMTRLRRTNCSIDTVNADIDRFAHAIHQNSLCLLKPHNSLTDNRYSGDSLPNACLSSQRIEPVGSSPGAFLTRAAREMLP